ncbi:hypothetical protein AKJ09_03334 [Labilithrix luteola]|uniref:Glycoside hydrolase family 31 N-terminal domain-containing protein n=1 Tax=Labilithrix luteola TaxID=1391654 RepID=A0A0K1PSZ8_9BACT|nr:hypothetical protein AKJ09_03334 [Labilithrix luteola]
MLGALVFGLALAPAACSGGTEPSAPMPTTLLGAGAYGVAVVDGGRSIELRRGDAPLVVLGPDAFQLGTSEESAESVNLDPYILEAHASELVTYRSPTSIRATKDGDGVAIDLAYDGGFTARALVRNMDSARFSIEVQPGRNPEGAPGLGVGIVRVRAKTNGPSTEGFYGLGEWEDSVDHRGKLRPMQIEVDTEYESATNENHVPVPLLLGTSGWGLFVASTRPASLPSGVRLGLRDAFPPLPCGEVGRACRDADRHLAGGPRRHLHEARRALRSAKQQ